MLNSVSAGPIRFRILLTRWLSPIGFRDGGFLLLIAILIGVITAAAAVGFHVLITSVRDGLYARVGPSLYGPSLPLLIAWPALGGLAVGVISQKIMRAREGHGVVADQHVKLVAFILGELF